MGDALFLSHLHDDAPHEVLAASGEMFMIGAGLRRKHAQYSHGVHRVEGG